MLLTALPPVARGTSHFDVLSRSNSRSNSTSRLPANLETNSSRYPDTAASPGSEECSHNLRWMTAVSATRSARSFAVRSWRNPSYSCRRLADRSEVSIAAAAEPDTCPPRRRGFRIFYSMGKILQGRVRQMARRVSGTGLCVFRFEPRQVPLQMRGIRPAREPPRAFCSENRCRD